MSATKTMTESEKDTEAPLLESEKEPEVLRPLPVRAVHAALHFCFMLFGKEYGWAGFCFLVIGTTCSVATSVHVNWLGGCAVMMVFFASCFCFAGFQAVSGKYELARPLLLSAMMLFLSCILGGHFFVVWSKSAGSQVIKDSYLKDLPAASAGYHENALFYLKDGSVGADQMGVKKVCKDKLPVVGTCVYNYFCVAPVLEGPYEKGAEVNAWVGILSHVDCSLASFTTSPARKAWDHPYRAGLGMHRDKHWNEAIGASSKKFGLKSNKGAPLINWVADPTHDEKVAWHTGWLVEFTVFCMYLVVMLVYSYCTGISEDALPETRKIMDPNAPLKPSRRKKVDP
mmetsp:Transcript_40280/g.62877  ORF Transcript_40280/g.62877 Transcript_40280/m.62877 type:complete len:342 (+) Transcript_40280:161-1186(+)